MLDLREEDIKMFMLTLKALAKEDVIESYIPYENSNNNKTIPILASIS